MSTEWRGPDDSLSKRDAKGELAGARRVKEALAKHGIHPGKKVISSKDPDWMKVRDTLERQGMPHGVKQWQLPTGLGPKQDCNCFLGEIEPNTVVPKHHHTVDVFRAVIDGEVEVTIDGETTTLGAGDWILIRAGTDYSLRTRHKKLIHWYHHP